MPAMFVFLLKVNIALILFCAGYYAVLRHLTFYTLNRIYLVAAILFASVYPQINLDSFAQRHQQLTQPVQVILNLQAPAQNLIRPIAQPNYWYWAEVVFWIGAALLALRLLMQLYSLYKLYRSSSPANIEGHRVRTIKGDSGPFSFWKSIYVNPDNHHPADLRSILLHEQVHVNQWHTLDILLAELSTIFYWFNPGIWLIKKAVRENIEFITDNKILKSGADSKAYQYSLVNISFAGGPQNIVNHFNLSTIKKRIIMMNAKRSSKFNLTRYAFLMPAVIALLLVFSISKAAFITKSSTVIMHNLAATISAAHIVHDDVQNEQLAQPVTITKAKKIKARPVDTIQAIKQDGLTIYPGDTIIAKKGGKKPIYIVDGKEVENVDFRELVPEKIATINVTGDGKIYIITKPKSASDIIKINGQLLKTISDKVINGDGVVYDTVKVNGRTVIDTVYLKSGTRASNGLSAVTVEGRPAVVRKGLSNVTVIDKPLTITSLTSKLYGTVSGYRSARPVDLDHLDDKMFVIDGKPATEKEMKKLSMFSIERIAVKTDEETKSLYGDKAKNGVVFIVTKKKM